MLGVLQFLDSHAGAIQSMLTLTLILATWRYVSIANDSLHLARKQFEEITRAEVYVTLKIEPQTMDRENGVVELHNLSSRGIWWENFSVTAVSEHQNLAGKPVVVLVEKVVPAYSSENVSGENCFFVSFKATGLPEDLNSYCFITISVKYRVGTKPFTYEYKVPQVMRVGQRLLTPKTELDRILER